MNCTTLLTHWKDSLKLFHRATFSLYLLGCLNTIKLALPSLLKYFWWAFAGLIAVRIWGTPRTVGEITLLHMQVGVYIRILLQTILLYAYIMSMRPSIEPKNGTYYLSYVIKTFWAVALTYFLQSVSIFATDVLVLKYSFPFIILTLLFFFESKLTSFSKIFWVVTVTLWLLHGYFPPFVSVGGIMLMIFLMPKDYWLSWFKTVKTIWYLFPAVLILFFGNIILSFYGYQLAYALDFYIHGLLVPVLAIVHLLNYASLTVFYVRIKHNYFHLIFE